MVQVHPEAKVITYLSEDEVGTDVHIVKETTFNDGVYKDNIRVIEDYKRPFHITKELYRNHKGKKELEKKSKVNTYMSTQSKLYNNIGSRLGIYGSKPDVRKIKQSPYLYTSDVDARTFLKNDYIQRNQNFMSPYRVGVFDIEFDTLKSEIIILSIATKDRLLVTLLKSYADTIPNMNATLKRLHNKFIPDVSAKLGIRVEYIVFDDEVGMINHAFQEANKMEIDTLTAWNISYDITQILDVLEREEIDPADVFHYSRIPEKYKFFSFVEGRAVKHDGTGINPEDRWHKIKTTANYQLICAMSSHRAIRVGGASVPGGYSLDNILKSEGITGKLKFSSNQGFKGIEWHIDMVANKPAEYITYNEWDDLSILMLDKKTKDLSISLPLLAGVSHTDIFSSGPKRIVDALSFFYADKDLVLGVNDLTEARDDILGMKQWIITLDAYLTTENGLKIIEEYPDIITNIKSYVYDSDAVSSYPSNTMAANVSKDTTHREVIAIEGIVALLFRMQNMNLMYGKTNSLEYCQKMFKMPSLFDIIENVA